jgi:hypothetical protein
MIYDFNKYEPTHNKMIDLCANVISLARERNEPIKALHLKPMNYEWFKSGVQTLLNRPLEVEELLEFDGVNIELGSKFQSKTIVIEYYERQQAIV